MLGLSREMISAGTIDPYKGRCVVYAQARGKQFTTLGDDDVFF
jgi:hypothetical protein